MSLPAAAVAIVKRPMDAALDLSVASIDESNPSEVRSQDSLADAAYGPESSMSLSRISFERSAVAQSLRVSASSCRTSRQAAAHQPSVNIRRPAPPQPQQPREPHTGYVATTNPRKLSTTFIEERLRELARVLARLAPGGVAHEKLVAQRDRLTAELARRRDAAHGRGQRDCEPASVSVDSAEAGTLASRPIGSALRAVVAIRAAEPRD